MNTCAACQTPTRRGTAPYWDPTQWLCPDCAHAIATLLTRLDRWPRVPIPDTPAELLTHTRPFFNG